MRLPRIHAIFFLAIGVLLIALCPCARAQSVPAPLKPEASVQFSMAQGEDVFNALYILAENAPALVDVEVVRKHGQDVSRVVPYFSIPLGTYTLSELLMLFQTALPEMSWSRDEHEYHVKVVLDKTVDNSLDYLVPEDISATKTGIDWVDWLNQENLRSGMICNRDGLFMGCGPMGPENDVVSLTVKKGMTYRQVLDEISEFDQTNWEADVEDKSDYGFFCGEIFRSNPYVPHGYVHLRGSDENLGEKGKQSVPSPKPVPIPSENDYYERTGVTFHLFYWKRTSPGTTIAPVAPITSSHLKLRHL